MIEYNSKSALLEIPKGLGNFAENGSGGGQDIGPLSGSVVELSATTVGIETNLGNLSGSTETLAQELGELSGTTDSIGDAVADLLLDVDDLDTRVSGNTENIEALSGVTSGLSGNIIELSGVTSGLAQDIQDISGHTYDLGSGLTVNDNRLSVAIGEGLAYSGNTIVVSGGTGGGPKIVILNRLSQAERVALYNELFQYYDAQTGEVSSAYTPDDYAFYLAILDNNDKNTFQLNDQYQGYFPMQMAFIHPTDYGGGIFFVGVESIRQANANLANIKYVITYDGQVDLGTWWVQAPSTIPGAGDNIAFSIDSAGTLTGNYGYIYGRFELNTYYDNNIFRPFNISVYYDGQDTRDYYLGTIESVSLSQPFEGENGRSAIFTGKVNWSGQTYVGKWHMYCENSNWSCDTLYWGVLVDGLCCVYWDEYHNWSQADREKWYDQIIEEVWNYDNTAFGIIKVDNKTDSGSTGYDHISGVWNICKLDSVEAGYNSLHFSGSEISGDGPSQRCYNMRVSRGNNIEWWLKNADFSWIYQKQPSGDGGRTFNFNSGGTPEGYFDAYLFNAAFGTTHNPWEFYGGAGFGAIKIVDPDRDYEQIACGNVTASRPLNSSDGYVDMSSGARVAIEFVIGGNLYRMLGDSVWNGQDEGWHLKKLTVIDTF